MSHAFPNWSAPADSASTTQESTQASLSFSATDATVAGDFTLSYPPSNLQQNDVALPRILHPNTAAITTRVPTGPVAWPPLVPSAHKDAETSSPTVHRDAMAPHPMDVARTKQQQHQLYSREEQEPTSLFSSRNRQGEMSSFGISVSTATAAGGWSASTMPTRWLKSAEVRPLGGASDSGSPRRNPNSVFERWVQREVVRTERQDAAMLSAAAHFGALFD